MNNTAVITRTVLLPYVSSGSALEILENELLICSDDAAHLYRYQLSTGKTDSIHLNFLPSREHRIPKPEKPDFEASLLTQQDGLWTVIAFGSGSAGPQRETVAYVSLNAAVLSKNYNAGSLYAHLQHATGIEKKDFNIEAAALLGDQVVLFNRGSQQMLQMSWRALDAHLRLSGPLPEVKALSLPLPHGIKAGYSGAYAIDENTIVFTASQEETTDWYLDGAISGSAVGFLKRTKGNAWKPDGYYLATDVSGKQVPEKVEGIVPHPSGKAGHFIAITDNDDGSSKLLWIEIR